MDRILSLRIYTRVAELKSFTKAAESVGLPKASVSTQIQQLENEMGTRLLHRTTRSVQLTQDGTAFYERCKDLLADIDEVQSMFQEGATGLSGRIRIDMPSRMARFIILPRLHEFLALHPGIEVEFGSTDREVDLVREGYDCVVRAGELEDSGLIARKLGEVEIVNCASPSYLKAYGKPRSVADLSKHLMVHYVSTFGEKTDGFEYFDGKEYRTVPMRGRVTVNNAESYTAACVGGLGIIQSPLQSLQRHFKQKELVEVLPNLKAEPMPVSILYPHQRNLPRRVKVFMDWLESLIKKESGFTPVSRAANLGASARSGR